MKAGAIAILSTIFLGLSGWTMSEVAELKERVKGNEVSRENIVELVKEIRAEQKEMRGDIKLLLERRK